MNNEKFKGVFTALLTPFDANDEVNVPVLERLIERNIAQGVSGFYVTGSTGEAFLLSESERKLVLSTVAKVAKGRVTLIAHVGCISTKQSVELAVLAKELGYDAVSSMSPFYYKFGFAELKAHYEAISGVGLPVIVYNIPALSGVSYGVDQLGELLNIDGVIGIKHTSTNYHQLERLKKAYPDKLVYNGYDESYLCGLIMGCDGAIGSTFNFMADKFVAITKAYKNGDIAEAKRIQAEANDVLDPLLTVGVMSGEKEILNQLGYGFGASRAPFAPLSDADKKLVSTIMDRVSKD